MTALLASAVAAPAFAQVVLPPQRPPLLEDRPGDAGPGLEDPVIEEEPALVLPPLAPFPPAEELAPLPGAGRKLFVRRFKVVGSTIFSAEELAALTAAYENRELDSEELHRVRDAITRHYIQHGFVSSGAIIPDQSVIDGDITLEVIEGRLTEISIEAALGTQLRLREHYLRSRIALAADGPLNVNRLHERLRLLQRDPRIRRLHAQLRPGLRPGESSLVVAVEEERPYALFADLANNRSPSIGSVEGRVSVEHLNVAGWGDAFRAAIGGSEGLMEVEAGYAFPLSARETLLDLHFEWRKSEIIESPFDELDIESEWISAGATLSHPLYRSASQEFLVGLAGEYRSSQSSLLGTNFPFAPGSEKGKSTVTVLRLFQDWSWRTTSQALAARSTLSVGIDALGSTANPSGVPDGRFVSWLVQAQWVRRLGERFWRAQLLGRADLQLAHDPLLAMEQFAVGGMGSVRGYRENQLVRDNGFVGSLELRIPIFERGLGEHVVQLAPFADYGVSWSKKTRLTAGGDKTRPSPESLASLGVGLRYTLRGRITAELYWGGRLQDVDRSGNDPQDSGFHFRLSGRVF